MKLHKIILLSLGIFLSVPGSGQEISLYADYPEAVRVGQQFTVSWTANTDAGEFAPPSFEGFYKLMGPQTSFSSSTQIINGKITREIKYTYIYYLQAVSEGHFVIPPASIAIKGNTYSSDSLHIEVVASATSHSNIPEQKNQKSVISGQDYSGDDIFLVLSLDKNEVYQGEHIAATIKLYTRVDISGINEIKFPTFEGFIKADLETPPLTSLKQENVNGTIYGTGVIQQFLLYPQLTGEISIEPVQITALIQQRTGRSDPFFGDFFSTYTNVPRVVVSRAKKVIVKPLPFPKPDDFSGVAGKINLTASIDKDSVTVNDAVNLKIVISGKGNIKFANITHLKIPPDVEMYDPKVSDNLKNSINGTSGEKIFEYLLIPRHNGDFSIPPVSLSYFNLSTKKYEKLITNELRFHARKGTTESGAITVYGSVSKEDVRYLGKDIRFIESAPGKLRKSGDVLSSKRLFYSVYAFAFMIFLAVLLIRKGQIKRNSDLKMVRNRKAARVAGKRLKEASIYLKAGLTDKVYEEILKSIWGYLSDKLDIPVSDLTRNNAADSLKEHGIDEKIINNLNNILDTCEYSRYAPSSTSFKASDIYRDASMFIRSVENSIN